MHFSVMPGKFRAVLKDSVFRALVLLVSCLVLLDRAQVIPSLVFTLESLWQMLPFFLLAIGLAAFAKASNADSLIAGVFSGNPVRATSGCACGCAVTILFLWCYSLNRRNARGRCAFGARNGILDFLADHGPGNVHSDDCWYRA